MTETEKHRQFIRKFEFAGIDMPYFIEGLRQDIANGKFHKDPYNRPQKPYVNRSKTEKGLAREKRIRERAFEIHFYRGKLSPADIANKVGITRSCVYKYLSGFITRIPKDELRAGVEAFGLSLVGRN